MELTRAFQHLRNTERVIFPHRLLPGDFKGGADGNFTEAEWSAYMWNPNPQFTDLGIDAAASPKPAWSELMQAADDIGKIDVRRFLNRQLDREATRRITAAYGARDLAHETRIRLRGAHTAFQDSERLRLHAQHDQLQNWIADTARTLAELEAFDPTDDAHWPAFTIELTAAPVERTASEARQFIALTITATAPATFNLTYTNVIRVFAAADLEEPAITELTAANAGISTVWITRATADAQRELTAEISVFASPYGFLTGSSADLTFPAI